MAANSSTGSGSGQSIGTDRHVADSFEVLKRSIRSDVDAAEDALLRIAALVQQDGSQRQQSTPVSPPGTEQNKIFEERRRKLDKFLHSMGSQWPRTDREVEIQAGQLRLDIEGLAREFFNFADVTPLNHPELYDHLNLPEPLGTFMDMMGAFTEEDIRDWILCIQDTTMRSRIMTRFIWKFLLRWVFGRFLWMGDLNGAARRIGEAIFPEDWGE